MFTALHQLSHRMVGKEIAVLLLVLALGSPIQGLLTSCPHFFQLRNGRCYFFSQSINSAYTWFNARSFCQSYTDSTSRYDLLVMDSTSDEYTFIRTEMDIGGYVDAFVGTFDLNSNEGIWTWVDGSSMSLRDPLWTCNYPTSSYNRNCGILVNYLESVTPVVTRRMRLQDFDCYSTRYFICEGYSTTKLTEEEELLLKDGENNTDKLLITNDAKIF